MVQSGWNYNLTKKCVKTAQPSQPNYFEILAQCDPPPIPGIPQQHWSLGVSSENNDGVVCPVPAAQSFLINGAGSPVSLVWLPHTDESGNSNWAVNMKTDMYNFMHPCGAGHFTWYAFMDHIGLGGGPLPRPDQLRFGAVVNFNDYLPNGAARALAEFQGYWGGKVRYVDVSFSRTNWGDNYPGDPMIYEYRDSPEFTYISVSGEYFGISAPKAQDTLLQVNWSAILGTLIAAGRLPVYGDNPSASAVGISHETYNGAPSLSAVSDLWFTNFRISSI